MSEENTQVKISMPLIDDIELQRIDTFYNDIVSEYTKAFVKEKEQVIIQRLMMNLQQENEQLKADLTKEKLAYSNLRDTYNKKYDECKLYKEVIEEVRELRDQFIDENELSVWGNDSLINFVNKLLQILNKVKGE